MSCLNHRKHDDHDVLLRTTRRKRRVQRREAPKRRVRRRGELTKQRSCTLAACV